MALDFSNDDAQNNNGVADIDVDAFTMSCWLYVDNTSAIDTVYSTNTVISSGALAAAFAVEDPASSGFRLRFHYNFSGTNGRWRYNTDLALNQWHHILVSYDRSSTTNDPTFYINGSLISSGDITEVATPVGTGVSGVDSVIFGKTAGLTSPYNGKIAEATFWSGDKTSLAASLSKGFSPEFFPQDLKCYWDMIRTGREKRQGADLTLTGATAIAHPPIIYPAPVSSGFGAVAAAAGFQPAWAQNSTLTQGIPGVV